MLEQTTHLTSDMKLHNIQGYIQQIYLVEYSDKLLLLDGASRADVGVILRFIRNQLGRPIGDLKTVVVTHMHPDHAGAAHRLRSITGCQIVASYSDTAWYSGLDGLLMHLTDVMLALWMAMRMGKAKKNLWYSKVLKPDLMLTDEQAIPNFDDWRVLETPGHTDRDISVYNAKESVVYVADLMVEVKKRLVAPFPVFYPNQYRKSVERIYDLNVDTLLLAHKGQVNFSFEAKSYLLETAPRRPVTHWRVVKIKFKKLTRSLFSRQ